MKLNIILLAAAAVTGALAAPAADQSAPASSGLELQERGTCWNRSSCGFAWSFRKASSSDDIFKC
jgi:hypothetical protein